MTNILPTIPADARADELDTIAEILTLAMDDAPLYVDADELHASFLAASEDDRNTWAPVYNGDGAIVAHIPVYSYHKNHNGEFAVRSWFHNAGETAIFRPMDPGY